MQKDLQKLLEFVQDYEFIMGVCRLGGLLLEKYMSFGKDTSMLDDEVTQNTSTRVPSTGKRVNK